MPLFRKKRDRMDVMAERMLADIDGRVRAGFTEFDMEVFEREIPPFGDIQLIASEVCRRIEEHGHKAKVVKVQSPVKAMIYVHAGPPSRMQSDS